LYLFYYYMPVLLKEEVVKFYGYTIYELLYYIIYIFIDFLLGNLPL